MGMPKETFLNLLDEKQEKVMRAAISEFIEHGFEQAKIGTIAKNAGVAKGSMYQYFENKKELFLFSVEWSIKLLMQKFGQNMVEETKRVNLFDYFFINVKEIWEQMKDEREMVIFVQDVFLGKYSNLTDESMSYMMKVSDEYMMQIIHESVINGYVRDDIDENILRIFMTGVTFKIKEYIMLKARDAGGDMVDEDYEEAEKDVFAMLDLLKHGMASKKEDI